MPGPQRSPTWRPGDPASPVQPRHPIHRPEGSASGASDHGRRWVTWPLVVLIVALVCLEIWVIESSSASYSATVESVVPGPKPSPFVEVRVRVRNNGSPGVPSCTVTLFGRNGTVGQRTVAIPYRTDEASIPTKASVVEIVPVTTQGPNAHAQAGVVVSRATVRCT